MLALFKARAMPAELLVQTARQAAQSAIQFHLKKFCLQLRGGQTTSLLQLV
jgi:hypothetical protein